MDKNTPALWGTTEAYERYMGRWSRKVAPLFVDWLTAPHDKDWLDVGCGTGCLSGEITARCSPKSVLGMDQSLGYVQQAAEHVPTATFREGDALAIDLPDSSVDCVVSGLLLNFLPDKEKGLSEMVRVTRPGGTVSLYVWDYAGHMQIMRHFFDVARGFDPESSKYDDGIRAPICRPGPLSAALTAAGLTDVDISPIDIPTPFENFDDYWSPFLGGTGSAPKYCVSIDEELRAKIRDAVRERLPTGPDGEILLAARVWAAKGTKPV